MILNDETFNIIAIKCYDNPHCTGLKEYQEDIKIFNYVRKLLRKRSKGKYLNVKLTLNHIIVLYNLFGYKTTDLLFYKIDKSYLKYLIPFLIFLDYFPNSLNIDDYEYDEEILNQLKEL